MENKTYELGDLREVLGGIVTLEQQLSYLKKLVTELRMKSLNQNGGKNGS